jgi:hypothetical protein
LIICGDYTTHENFNYNKESLKYGFIEGNKPAIAFSLKYISELQFSETVPIIDI